MNTMITKAIQIILLIVPFILIAFFWDKIPAEVPTHFGINGNASDYVPKTWGIFLVPAIEIFVYLLLLAVPYIDPKRKTEEFKNSMNIFATILNVFLTAIFVAMLMNILGVFENAILYVIVFMFLVMGNFFGKLRPNYFIGIRTPWTLENETIWIKTHRLGGYLWVIASLIMLFLLFIPDKKLLENIFLAYVGIIAGIPILYSFLLYRKMKSEDTE